jgi:hypothetical protein
VCAEYSASKLVVEATLVKVDPIDYDTSLKAASAYYYTLKIDHTFRGMPEQVIRVYEENNSGRAPFEWKLGAKYILFLSDFSGGPEKGLFELDGCGNSRPLSHASFVLKQIAGVKHRRTALITGMVGGIGGIGPWPNIEIIAEADGVTYKGATDGEGRFSIEAPPGHYTVKPADALMLFEAYDLSYEDPQNLRLEPGSCVQVQFEGKPRR